VAKMSYKEQFFSKQYNKEELLKGYVSNLSYEEYIYYVACLSDFYYKERKYQRSLYFYDHLIRSIGCSEILRRFERTGKKIPNELKKYVVDLSELINSKEAEELGKKVDKIAGRHTTKRFVFQLIMIGVGFLVGLILFLLKTQELVYMMVGFAVAAIVPLFYRPKPITIDRGVELEKNMYYVARHNKDLFEYVQQKVKKDKSYKELNNNESAE
jgi:hypothetical protein